MKLDQEPILRQISCLLKENVNSPLKHLLSTVLQAAESPQAHQKRGDVFSLAETTGYPLAYYIATALPTVRCFAEALSQRVFVALLFGGDLPVRGR